MKSSSIRFSLMYGFCALGALGLAACGNGGDQETSVLVVVKNATGSPWPDQVQIDVYKGEGGVPESLSRAAPAEAAMDTRLGDLVIYPMPGTATLRIAAFGKRAGAVVSSGVVEVGIVSGKQVSVDVVLTAGLLMGDGGLLPADGGADAANGDDAGATPDGPDGPATDGATLGLDGADAAPMKTDTMVAPKKSTGETCGQGTECMSGSCLQQVCCDKACDGTCNTCKAAGQPLGMCTPLPNGTTCGDTNCGPGGASMRLLRYQCMAGMCQSKEERCPCSKATLMCL